MAAAQALVSTGLRDAGFVYVNIDAGSLQRSRGRDGKIAPDAQKFPRGMRFLADRLHAMGLKLGVYTDLSDGSCGTGPSSGPAGAVRPHTVRTFRVHASRCTRRTF